MKLANFCIRFRKATLIGKSRFSFNIHYFQLLLVHKKGGPNKWGGGGEEVGGGHLEHLVKSNKQGVGKSRGRWLEISIK